jgi:hypothetical protein
MIRGRYSGVGDRDVDKHQQTKRMDMSRRMRGAQPKSAVRSIRVAIGAGPEQLSLTRFPAEDYASRGEFTRVRHPHLLFSCIFRSPSNAHRCRSATSRTTVLLMSAAADDRGARGEFARLRHPRCFFTVFTASRTVEWTPKVRQGYKGHVLERRTDVQEKTAYFQPGVQAFGD